MEDFLYTSSAKATLFDIVAEDSLRASLKPAWEYLCQLAKTKYPQGLAHVLKYSDEIFYVALFIMEEYNLRLKSASITESFYELARESTSRRGTFMLNNARWIALLSVVALPYVLDKLQKRYEKLKEDVLVENFYLSSFDRMFYRIYPILSTLVKWIRIVNYILYLFGFTNYPFPLLRLIKMELKYAENEKRYPKFEKYNGRFYLLYRMREMCMLLLSKITPVLFYSLQFLDTFYQEDIDTKNVLTNMPVTEPPKMPKIISTQVKLPPSKKQCPLCRQVHVKPTTTRNSGFVFCYTCLHKYINQFNCCPVTYRPCNVDDMIALH